MYKVIDIENLDNKVISGIYMIKCKFTVKFYIGRSKNIVYRFLDHMKDLSLGRRKSGKWYSDFKQYGKESFILYLIELVNNLNTIKIREQYYLNLFLKKNKDFMYNISTAADGFLPGVIFTKEHCKNIRESKLGIIFSKKAIKNMSLAKEGNKNYMYGKTHDKRVRELISKVHKGKKLTLEHVEKISKANKGHAVSEETKNKIRKASTGRIKTKEEIEKIRKSQVGKFISLETRKKMSKSHKGLVEGKNNPMFGKIHSEESKKLISKNHADVKGKNHPLYGKNHSEETKVKMKKAWVKRKLKIGEK